ncbi:flagellar hook capping protein [Allosphingosinicella flava]|uniref:Basal-body rod modification protein FlgD n=1 Tax=Allosphingosinicella flava TaxID=2771430 RepID=A0A7T2GK88_9SPHN|nr:flagellar hook capping FlgD N-terminal domain-containing protein [Sphingosinicella flava]QPQ55337.1 flagellar hook capping protein [Sphingosinicella flava]
MTTITGTAAPAAAPGATGGASATLDQNAFLRLMTTQLTTQDPFDPMDNTQMVAQLAQFSQVSGIASMSQALQNLAQTLTGGRLSDAAGWIGRSMLVLSDHAAPLGDGSYSGEVHLAEASDDVTVNFVDDTGAVVHSQQMGAKDKGSFAYQWDGKNEAGQAVPGPLKVVVTANDADGKPIQTANASWTRVHSIQSPASGGTAGLLTGLGTLSPDDAIRLA